MSAYAHLKSRPPAYDLLVFFGGLMLVGLLVWQFALPLLSRQDPQLVRAQNALAKNSVDEARTRFNQYLQGQPHSAARYCDVLVACVESHRFDLEKEYALRAIEACKDATAPERAILYSQLANAYAETQEPAPQPLALEAARRALELAPDEPQYQNGLGYLIADNNGTPAELDQAETLIRRAIATVKTQGDGPNEQVELAMFMDSYAWVLFKKGHYPQAVNALTQTIDDMPARIRSDPAIMKIIYYHLGAAYSRTGQTPQARAALEASLRYDPKYAPASDVLAHLPP